MQAIALMVRRQLRQPVCSFDGEKFEDFHVGMETGVSAQFNRFPVRPLCAAARIHPSRVRTINMTQPLLPILVEPAELEPKLRASNLLLVDLNRAEVYVQAHLPGAVRLEYADIAIAKPPALGLLPDAKRLSEILSGVGLTPDKHVVAYDADGGSRAARFLWTLEAVGHRRYSLLNGGNVAWQHESRPLVTEPTTPRPSQYTATLHDGVVADQRWILDHVNDPAVTILDARTAGEYSGAVLRSARGGHIPGAINFDYSNAIDTTRQMRLKPTEELRQGLMRAGVVPDKEIVVYCQTHHRSAHTWFVLKVLGFENVRGYPGSWSEWGNRLDTPVESG